jgi:ribonuclease P protein component
MLPREHRLKRSRDFSRVRRHGRSSSSALAALYVLPTRSDELRVGFSVSKRVGKATVRNRVKRLFREAARHELPRVRRGQDLVFIARPPAAGASYGDVAAAVESLLARAGALRPRPGERSRA